MLIFSILLLISSVYGLEKNWEGYKGFFNKNYTRGEALRKYAWRRNAAKVLKHNAEADEGKHGYKLGANNLADLSRSDYLKLIGLKGSSQRKLEPMLAGNWLKDQDVPEEFDWREKGFVTPAYDQQTCGSCYAFSVASSVQGQMFRKKGSLKELSEQQLVDCTVVYGNLGCSGGSFRNTLRYLQLHGLMEESDYPYKGQQSVCRYVPHKAKARISSWSVIPSRDEEALKAAVATIGPIPVSVNASPHTFQLYHSGVYDDSSCPDDSLNHAMLLVGYTKNAWILKNWWTDQWGENGYMKLKRGKNRCGIANYAIYIKA